MMKTFCVIARRPTEPALSGAEWADAAIFFANALRVL